MNMLDPGQVIGNYRILQKLGEGGMGAVFEAEHQDIGRHVAIKVLHQEYAKDAQTAARFLNEARAATIVDHPGIVDIFEYGRLPDGTTFLVMEYVKGPSLRTLLKREGKLLTRDALRITRQIALTLAAAHDKGIVHRDLKPDNVIIAPDRESPGHERAKVLDFGIAKVADGYQKQEGEHVKTQTGMMLGTPLYMSPEQCRGAERVTDKGDVYSLGVMLFQMLCGKPPFERQGMGALVLAHMLEPPPQLLSLEPTLAVEVATLVHRMLDKNPEERPTMHAVVAELENLGADRTGLGVPGRESIKLPSIVAERSGGAVRGMRRVPLWLLGVAVLLGVVVTLTGGWSLRGLRRHRAANPPTQSAPPLHNQAVAGVHWLVQSEPPGAELIRASDEKLLGLTPVELFEERRAPPAVLKLVLRKRGYMKKEISLELSQEGKRNEILVPQSDEQIKLLE